MTIGLVMLLCHSRLLGMTVLWQGLLGEHYVRVFKNVVEEGSELLAYTFILFASLSYAAQSIREPAAVWVTARRGSDARHRVGYARSAQPESGNFSGK
jgi:hypothetical protein